MTRCGSTILAFALALPSAVPAFAQSSGVVQEQREYCPDRPGLGTPACTMAAGRVSIETAVVDWTRDNSPDERSDSILIGDTLVRVGLSGSVEAQLGWTPFGHLRTRDKPSGSVDKADRAGDVLLGLRANLSNPDGSGFSAALQPFATLPIGRAPLGAGDWSFGVIVPVGFDLTPALNLQFSPQIDAAADEDRHGRHLAYGSAIGLGVSVSDATEVTFEMEATRDNDPVSHSTQVYAAVSTGWKPSDNLHLDLGATVGLNHSAADMEFYMGISRRL